MRYSMSFGQLAAPAKSSRQGVGEVFGVVVLGDFSGRANRGELETGDALARRKPRRVDVDNIDDVLASMQLVLQLPIGDDGASVEVKLASLDDFHPNQLYLQVEAFAKLAGLRDKLHETSTFEGAAAVVRGWGDTSPSSEGRTRAKARGEAIPNAKLSDFARLMGSKTAVDQSTTVRELIKQIVRPHIRATASPDQAELVAAVDRSLSTTMRRLLHHSDFQTLESLWRSVDLLVRELETDGSLQIILYDVTAEELAADLSSNDKLEETGLYKLLVEQPALDTRTVPPSAIVGNYTFEQTPPHAELLGRIAKVAAAAGAPFLAAIGSEAFEKKKPEEIHPLVVESWGALRALPHAAYLGLTVPRFMLRWPYGAKTEPIDPFPFEEFTASFGLKGFLWGNAANLAGLLLGKTFAQQGMGGMEPGSIMVQGDLPLYYFTDADGDQIALPCTERIASEAAAAHIISQGFMPLLWMRGRPEVRLGSFAAINGAQLAGPWAPVDVPSDPVDTVTTPVVASPTPVEAPPESPEGVAEAAPAVVEAEPVAEPDLPAEELEAAAAPVDEAPPVVEQSTNDLDNLLDEIEDDSPATVAESMVPASSVETADEDNASSELDDLLASIEEAGQESDEGDDEGDMDPDLAALLAEL